MDTLVKIAEDALLLAANIRGGEDLDASSYIDADLDGHEAYQVAREFRIVELVVDLAERLVATTGIDPETVWTPTDVADLLDAEWGANRKAVA